MYCYWSNENIDVDLEVSFTLIILQTRNDNTLVGRRIEI
jgi:hypothetical protein